MLPQHSVAELAHARTEIAEQIFIAAGDDFDAARIAAEGTPDRERQRLVDKRIDRVSSVRPRVASSASRILPRTATSRNGAGREPRVPQKRTRKDAASDRFASARDAIDWGCANARRGPLLLRSQRSGRDVRTG